jgi:hypothetical protein
MKQVIAYSPIDTMKLIFSLFLWLYLMSALWAEHII